MLKSQLRKKILKIRNLQSYKNNFIPNNFFFDLLKKKNLSKKMIGGYYPVNCEIDDLNILKELVKKKNKVSLPVVKKNFDMDFYEWNLEEPLILNKYGIPEPIKKNLVYPEILLIPLVAFDKKLNRLGYGGGYYDRYIEKISNKKNVLKIGLGLSMQEIDNVPTNYYDKRLDYIITEKNIL